ncbi:MAG: hypothetical protein EOM67_01340 [Spirochaetia bacterium]|nr:hypothetical protein [Spirochaetia bacterium]
MFGETLISIISIVTPFIFVAWIITTSRDRKAKKEHPNEELEQGIRDLAKRIENLEIIFRKNQSKDR